MSKTKTKVRTLDDVKENENEGTNIVLRLSSKIQETDNEIKQLRRKLKLMENESSVIIQGLLEKIKELEKIKSSYERKLKELGEKQNYIDNKEKEMAEALNRSMEVLSSKTTEGDEDITTEELEISTQKALNKLQELLSGTKV